MTVVMSMRWSGVTREQYDEARRTVDWDTLAPAGAILHVASFDDDALHVVDVWESAEQFQRFADTRLMPGIAHIGMPGEPEISIRPLHNLWSPVKELVG